MAKPDSGYSWIIVLSCGFIHFALFGIFRSSGVIYVALLEAYDATREEASWPFSLCSAIFQLVGPGSSILLRFMSQRSACLLGSAIATVGVTCCYFADSIAWINIFLGVVHGIGFGLIVIFVPVIISQYFVKHRATAIGLAFSGGTISSFIFPIAMEWLLENYGLNGSFLILGGLVMQTLAASALLRAPPWLKKQESLKPNKSEEFVDSGVMEDVAILKVKPGENAFISAEQYTLKKSSVGEVADQSFCVDQYCASITPPAYSNCDTALSNNDSVLYDSSNINGSYASNHKNLEGDLYYEYNNQEKLKNLENLNVDLNYKNLKQCKEINDKETCVPLMAEKRASIIPMQKLQTKVKFKCAMTGSMTNILKKPMFHLITFSLTVFFLGLHLFFMVIIDFAKDKGIPESNGIYIISMFSLTDLLGRVGLGWITDHNFMTRRNMLILNLAIIGILNQIYPFTDTMTGLLIVSAFHGLVIGSSITLLFVLQTEFFEMKQLTLAMGMTSFITGVFALLRPAVIGLFRDVIGSYDWLFHFVGILILSFAFIWLVESRLSEKRKEAKKEIRC